MVERNVGLREVEAEAVQGEIPPYAHRAGTEFLQVLLADAVLVRDVLERQARLVAGAGEAHVDPARAAHDLPRHVERLGRIAARDRAAGVALELISAAELQIALDR